MTLTYQLATQVLDALTYEANILADLAGQGVDLTGYDDFSTVKAVVNEQGRSRNMLAQLRAQIVGLVDPNTAPAAGDDWVDVHFGGFFDEPRIGALPSIGSLVVSVASGLGPFTYTAGQLLIEDTVTGQYYANTNAVPVVVAYGAPATIPMVAQVAGQAGNPLSGDTFSLVSASGSSGLGVSAATWVTTTAGRDKENSIAYIARCLAKWGTLGYGGNLAAYDYWIPTGTPTVNRWAVDVSNPYGPGSIGVHLADAAGPATTGEVTSVNAYLQPRKALGSGQLICLAAGTQTLTVTAISQKDGTNANALTNQAAALQLLVGACPLGGTVDLALLEMLLRGATVPFADVAVGSTSQIVQIGAPGFGGVTGVALSAPSSQFNLSLGAVLAISAGLS